MPVTVFAVEKESPAAHAGVHPGDVLNAINEMKFTTCWISAFTKRKNRSRFPAGCFRRAREVHIRKGQYESLGLSFETYLMDKQHSCRNKCVFCFIDQLPKGMRQSLYFKDDDSRLSFLFGNYITLTNLSQREADRIVKMHISPHQYFGAHHEPRTALPDDGQPVCRRFTALSLSICRSRRQAELPDRLCHGWNDGEELERTLGDLLALYPSVQSVALVPLGVTRFRDGLTPLTPYVRETALEVVRAGERWGEKMLEQHGERICYAADEFYLKAGFPFRMPRSMAHLISLKTASASLPIFGKASGMRLRRSPVMIFPDRARWSPAFLSRRFYRSCLTS